MKPLPFFIPSLFFILVLLSILILYRAMLPSKKTARTFLLLVAVIVVLQSTLSIMGFYTNTSGTPPRFAALLMPPLLMIIIFFVSKRGQQHMLVFDNKFLSSIHIIRIPVELVLYWLCLYKTIPSLMTFEGRNLDIVSGVSAVFITSFGYMLKKISPLILLIWNLVCLGLLVNIIRLAILSAPFSFQQLAFDQPNIALLYFPYTLLPGVIVPVVLFSQLVLIRKHLLQIRNSHKRSEQGNLTADLQITGK